MITPIITTTPFDLEPAALPMERQFPVIDVVKKRIPSHRKFNEKSEFHTRWIQLKLWNNTEKLMSYLTHNQ